LDVTRDDITTAYEFPATSFNLDAVVEIKWIMRLKTPANQKTEYLHDIGT
jgi:hypothetical protein